MKGRRCAYGAATVLLLIGGSAYMHGDGSPRHLLPPGVMISAGPVLQAEQPIVDVYLVKSEIINGEFVVRGVKIKNRSDKPVAAVRIGWRLHLPEAPRVTLAYGETPFLGAALAPDEKRFIAFPIVSGQKILESVGGNPSGHFRFEIFITEVLFDDRIDARIHGPAIFAESAKELPVILHVPDWQGEDCEDGEILSGPCQNQECRWNGSDCYECVSCTGSICKWSTCTSCCSGRCRLEQSQ